MLWQTLYMVSTGNGYIAVTSFLVVCLELCAGSLPNEMMRSTRQASLDSASLAKCLGDQEATTPELKAEFDEANEV